MKNVYLASDNIISPIGFTTDENVDSITRGISGIKRHDNADFGDALFFASLIDDDRLNHRVIELIPENKLGLGKNYKPGNDGSFTKFEKLIILSIEDALSKTDIKINDNKTLIIISTAKGNVDELEKGKDRGTRILPWESAEVLQGYFKNPNKPVVISNACISGLVGILTGSRCLVSSGYENIIITGADIISNFVVSGFHSLKTISPFPCRPYDSERKGLTLGEGAATLILTTNSGSVAGQEKIITTGGAVTNDANHITGPARTGDGLHFAIKRCLGDADLKPEEIDYISAHGTATKYNDEMESIAVSKAGLDEVPLNSLKGYFGHTLGASGIIESVITAYSMKNDVLFSTKGYEKNGVSGKINVIESLCNIKTDNCLKIASGFGGCNAVVAFSRA